MISWHHVALNRPIIASLYVKHLYHGDGEGGEAGMAGGGREVGKVKSDCVGKARHGRGVKGKTAVCDSYLHSLPKNRCDSHLSRPPV